MATTWRSPRIKILPPESAGEPMTLILSLLRASIKDRRAGVAPIEIEAGILFPEMAFPGELAIDVERRKLPVAEPRVDVGTIGGGARRGEIAFLVDVGQVTFRIQVVVPEAASLDAWCAATPKLIRSSLLSARDPPSGVSPSSAGLPSWTKVGCRPWRSPPAPV